MSTLASLLIAVGWIWLLVRAFQSSFWWGVGCLVLPLVWLLFALLHPREAAPPFAVFVAGMVLLILSLKPRRGQPVTVAEPRRTQITFLHARLQLPAAVQPAASGADRRPSLRDDS